jgi:preprotein translocase subunit SecA
MAFLDSLFSSQSLRQHEEVLKAVEKLSDEVAALSPEDIKEQIALLRRRAESERGDEALMAETFALVREAATRTLGERHYGVQIIGGSVLSKRSIAEMRTGEGKTLVATLPATFHALKGKGVHVVTVNDYLARRDAAWMGQVYDTLGLSVGVVTSTGSYLYDPAHQERDEERDESASFRVFYEFLRPVSKQEAYGADITYATNNELGFDYLRDHTTYMKEARVQRGLHFALIDEADSILIDEARTPLIISLPHADAESLYDRFARIAKTLEEGADYSIDEKRRAITLSQEGIRKAETALGVENLYAMGVKYAHHLDVAVQAKALFHLDKEYVVKDGKIVIVDEFTGRLQPGRRWSGGIHQAIEAKEGLTVQEESRTIASITFQNYFRLYDHLSGMTGTALSSKEEFYTVYGLDVFVIPTHRAIQRKDENDLIFQTAAGKYQSLVKKVRELHEKGQPVLIGTVSIDDNQIVSEYLTEARVPHEVLNAKNHEREGEIIAQAGEKGRVTVATNMAGRGVDIKLGGSPGTPEVRDDVRNLGGLVVLGTERHEARRIDNQLRGRSGRQGDPGFTQFYVSLEDKLMRVFAADTVKNLMGRLGIKEDEPIQTGMITKALESAQKKIEGFNFDARKQVLAYDDVLNHQRTIFYTRRDEILEASEEALEGHVRSLIGENTELLEALREKEEAIGKTDLYRGMRVLLLQMYDQAWTDHLETMEYLRRTVSLRAYGQRDPLVEYRKEGLTYFKEMESMIDEQVRMLIPKIEKRTPPPEQRALVTSGGSEGEGKAGTGVRKEVKIARNDTVTITNGERTETMKYKKAEELLKSGWKIVA